jgi:predicted dehydrogenase
VTVTPTSLRAGVVGAGLMGRWHAHAIRHVGGQVVALIDPDVQRAQRLAARLPGRPAADSELAAAIRAHRIEVLHVCTPLATHDAIARQAIEAGIPVLVEKPLAGDARATEALYALADARGVLLCPVHQFLFQPGILTAERAVPTLGVLRQLDVVACSAGADGASDDEREGVAVDILPHGLALARRLIRASLTGVEWDVSGGPPGEIRAMADIGGTSVMLAVSMRARPTENALTARFDLGTVRANLFHGFATIERGRHSRLDKLGRPFLTSAQAMGAAAENLARRLVRRESAYPGLRELVRRFHLACANRTPSPIGVDEAVDVAWARDSIREARRRRAPRPDF